MPKDTTLHQQRCTNLHSPSPLFTVLSVPDTVSNSHQIPKDTTHHQQRCTNLHCPQPTLYSTVSSRHCKQFTPNAERHYHSPTRCTNLHYPNPLFTVLSVPNTRTAFTYCCPFNWRRKTEGNFVLSIITSAFDGGEFLGSHPGRFIPGEEGQYRLTKGLCVSQGQSGRFTGQRKHSPLPEFELWDRPAQSHVSRPTATVLLKNLSLGSLVAY